MMKEVIERRYSRLLEHNKTLPDLILIDGGKGQLNGTMEVLDNLGLNIPTIGLAKRLEEIFIPGRDDSILLPEDSPILQLFQRIRDEAHRFAVRLHKTRRKKRLVGSKLEEIKGIGPATRNKLLKHFGSLKDVKKASEEELAKIISDRLTKKVLDFFKGE
jgi:excinuclease ABC subunit C